MKERESINLMRRRKEVQQRVNFEKSIKPDENHRTAIETKQSKSGNWSEMIFSPIYSNEI